MIAHRSRSGRAFGLICTVIAFVSAPCLVQARDVKISKDVVYGTIKRDKPATEPIRPATGPAVQPFSNELKLLLDVYEPDGYAGTRPGVVLIHGGGWSAGDKASYAETGKTLAAKGFVAFALNYRLAPAFHYPAQVDDVQRAVRWIRAHASNYNIDPNRLGAIGDSAGGYLVSLLGTRDTRDNKDLARYSSRVQCVVDLYGPTDLTAPETTARLPQFSAHIVENFIGKKRISAPELYRECSPVTYVDRMSAPFLIMHGELDPLVPVDQSERLRDALIKVGVEATLVIMPKDGHGFKSLRISRSRCR